MTLSAGNRQFLATTFGPGLAVAGLILLVSLAPHQDIHIAAIKTAIALMIGPTAGVIMHRACIPADHAPLPADHRIEVWRTALAADAARWRRVALVAAATLTIGVVLS